MGAAGTHLRQEAVTPVDVERVLDFLWLELTNRCNLQCVHCYTDSGPYTGDRDELTAEDYEDVMVQARALGCGRIQLIGGEPQLNPSFQRLLRATSDLGFDFVEVFSNLTRLDDETLAFSVEHGVHFATSVYSDDPATHDRVTRVRGSHRRTLRNLRRLIEAGVNTRAAVIAIDDDPDNLIRTRAFLAGLGTDVGMDRLAAPREFGRGQQLLGKTASMSGLCGNCWRGSLAIAPDGAVYTCVMAREWPVGDITEQTLAAVMRSSELARTRREIYEATVLPENACSPYCYQCCTPDWQCPCDPILCQQSCAPYGNPPVIRPK